LTLPLLLILLNLSQNYSGLEISCEFASSTQMYSMNTASKPGSHTKTDRVTYPGVGL
jgi:hypothetical protein